ncbi:Tn3 family transposase, partial [Sphingobium sp. CECT 9361]|uniref:Tn3 family transposase n=1 Tax=Sphingobium sp. CECT 9361 TaxID=2845384 RepID=UPI001E42ED6D
HNAAPLSERNVVPRMGDRQQQPARSRRVLQDDQNRSFGPTGPNTTYMQAARMHLASLGRSIPPDLLQHLSPLGWQHINLTGDYLWTDPDAPSPALRPLRQMHAVEGPAKP